MTSLCKIRYAWRESIYSFLRDGDEILILELLLQMTGEMKEYPGGSRKRVVLRNRHIRQPKQGAEEAEFHTKVPALQRESEVRACM